MGRLLLIAALAVQLGASLGAGVRTRTREVLGRMTRSRAGCSADARDPPSGPWGRCGGVPPIPWMPGAPIGSR